jgi:hypothetical protein
MIFLGSLEQVLINFPHMQKYGFLCERGWFTLALIISKEIIEYPIKPMPAAVKQLWIFSVKKAA